MDTFKGKIFVLGCGAVAQVALPMMIKEFANLPASLYTIMDMADTSSRIADVIAKGAKFVVGTLTPENYSDVLSKYLVAGDLFIDLSCNVESITLIEWCHEKNVIFVNSSVESWEPFPEIEPRYPQTYSLYTRLTTIRKMQKDWKHGGPTAVVDHGANPGLVSHFLKQALVDIANKILKEKADIPAERKAALEKALKERDFKKLPYLTGVKTIQISERDTQISNKPKEVNEFVNTWSIDGFIEEAMAPAELAWGTNEVSAPAGTMFQTDDGPRNMVQLPTRGMNTYVRSYVPSGDIIGMIVRHGETFSMSDYYTVWATPEEAAKLPPAPNPSHVMSDGRRVLYRPTCHYAYCPSDPAWNSIAELQMKHYVSQPRKRVMTDEIISGTDELGITLLGHDFGAWWVGSVLSIQEARRLVGGHNATTLQVAVGLIGAIVWSVKNPTKGLCLPDEMDHEDVLNFGYPYLGKWVSEPVDFNPLKMDSQTQYIEFGRNKPTTEHKYQFTTLLIKQDVYSEPPK